MLLMIGIPSFDESWGQLVPTGTVVPVLNSVHVDDENIVKVDAMCSMLLDRNALDKMHWYIRIMCIHEKTIHLLQEP